jgi:AraC family transcriptional regulator of adaptative response/methylated-DNA-[protein]-cysteine methyltransferase
LADCRFGPLLLGATGQGLCFLGFGEPPEALEADLRRRFPLARISPDPDALAASLRQVLAFLGDPRVGLDLPLDLHGTEFQRRVWDALVRIPLGETRTYAALAAEIGAPPAAARAVGRACALNPVSLAVPCHRMVGGDGGLHGYRWGGLPTKRLLQAMEQAAAAPVTSSG